MESIERGETVTLPRTTGVRERVKDSVRRTARKVILGDVDKPLRSTLRQEMQHLRKEMNKPPSVKLRDKISYTLGITNVMLTELVLLWVSILVVWCIQRACCLFAISLMHSNTVSSKLLDVVHRLAVATHAGPLLLFQVDKIPVLSNRLLLLHSACVLRSLDFA